MALDDAALDAARQRLAKEADMLQQELRELGATPDGSVEVAFDEGFADAGQATSERANVISMIDNLQQRLEEVRAAGQRIDRGAYGICERCGKPISEDRLEAIPSARLCISCAQKR